MQKFAIRVIEDDAYTGRAGHFIQIWINESDRCGNGFTWMRWGGYFYGLANLQPSKISFVGVEDELHFGEIGDGEDAVAGFHVAAFEGVALEDGAADGSENFGFARDGLCFCESVDLRIQESETH